jgi:inhibitor of KinA sporulation pathway (predicted exonuclease)
MPIRRDKLVVVDVEATCWENEQAPPGQKPEIIEIGICMLDLKTFERYDGRSLLVRPEKSSVSLYCTELTTLTYEQLKTEGMRFGEACDIVRGLYDSRDRAWTSWGNFDRQLFKEECKERGVRYPFSDTYLNASKLFRELESRSFKGIGMAKALEMIGIRLEGTHHRGEDDAWNIAGLIAYLLRKYGKDVLKPLWKE